MSGKHFMPRAQQPFAAWSTVFNTYLIAHGERLGVSPEQVADYDQKHQTMMAAMAVLRDPCTRGPAATLAKNDAMQQVRDTARRLARIIRANPQTTRRDRVIMRLALHRPGEGKGRIGPPTAAPQVSIVERTGRSIQIHLRDAVAKRRRRPPGVSGAHILYYIGPKPPNSLLKWSSLRTTSRPVCECNLPPSAQAGTILWVSACWLNPRGETGPYARPEKTLVPLGPAGIGNWIGNDVAHAA